ncbi:DUF4401 domain-containing protein [Fluviicola sp.]|uniref:DUF4401 domain-containing protein n=1 Tax=Fluviicola sp. TaxID=1917219 RepID=UPI0031DB58AD
MENQKHDQPAERWKQFFPDAVMETARVEKDLNYHGAHFGIRALEYVVFMGTLITLGLFGAAIYQIAEPGTGFYFFIALLFLAGTVVLHRTVHKRLIDALGTGLALVGTVSLIAALFSLDTFNDREVQGIILGVIVILVLVSRKNLLTILGVIASFWILNWLLESRDFSEDRFDTFRLVAMIFILLLGALVCLEGFIFSHYSRLVHFSNYLKHGVFLALCSYFVLDFDSWSWSRWTTFNSAKWLTLAMYVELLLFAVLLFVWQYRRLKREHLPLWIVVLLPLSLFLLGFFSVKIAFFLLAFLAFLFTRSLFGIITGALGLIYAVIHFYYELNWTLMQKSLVFIGLGVLYLGLFFLLNAKKMPHE